jgi:hypothetical protein
MKNIRQYKENGKNVAYSIWHFIVLMPCFCVCVLDIVTCLLKAVIAEPEETAIAGQ